MSKLISLSIDLSKIDKSKIVNGKNGALYYNLTIEVKDEKDQYGNDVSCWNPQSKEEKGEKRVYLGNGRVVFNSDNNNNKNTNNTYKEPILKVAENELPF